MPPHPDQAPMQPPPLQAQHPQNSHPHQHHHSQQRLQAPPVQVRQASHPTLALFLEHPSSWNALQLRPFGRSLGKGVGQASCNVSCQASCLGRVMDWVARSV